MDLKSTRAHGFCCQLLFVTAALIFIPNTYSVQFERGDVQGSFDSTWSIGGQWRVQSVDQDIISQANGGRNGLSTIGNNPLTANLGDGSSNIDDGNLNYSTGVISSTFKGIHELSMNWGDYGFFVRGRYFYDFENKDNVRDRRVAASTAASDVSFYNLLNVASGSLGQTPATSQHASGNLSTGTPYKLSDEAQDAVGARAEFLDLFLSASWSIEDMPLDLRLGRQVISWGESTFIQNGINVINPVDVPSLRLPGAEVRDALLPISSLWFSFGIHPNLSLEGFYQFEWEKTRVDEPGTYFATNDFVGEGGRYITISGIDECRNNISACRFPNTVSRLPDEDADDTGQFGFAFRWYAEQLNDTEFGLYYLNYHSRRPIISAVSGAYGANHISDFTTAFTTLSTVAPTAPADLLGALASFAAADNNLVEGTGEYFIEFPEDIQLIGLSFNTSLLDSGVSLSGEISYREDAPIQIDDQELLQAALCTIPDNFGAAQCLRSQYVAFIDPDLNLNPGDTIQGYIQTDVTQAQVTAIQVFGPTLGASQFALVGEVGATIVSLPETTQLAVQAPGSADDGYNADGSLGRGEKGFGEEVSWGYRVRARFDYNNVFAGWNLATTYSFSHDVNGTTPSPINNFLEDRKAFGLTLGFDYQRQIGVNLGVTTFFGAGEKNLINDRDFVSLAINYSI